MRQLYTPLLRRIYLCFGVFLLAYGGALLILRSEWHKEILYQRLIHGNRRESLSAAYDLAYFRGEKQLLRALKTPSEEVRQIAMQSLWSVWLHAAGGEAFAWTQQASAAAEHSGFRDALKILDRTVEKYPGFAEGWNRRATLYWQMGNYQKSVADCRRVLALNPNHFGAWEGMALCQLHLGDLGGAYASLKSALRINPFSRSLHNMLDQIERVPPEPKPPKGSVLI